MSYKKEGIKLGVIGRCLPYTLSPQIHKMFMKDIAPMDYDVIEVPSIEQLNKDNLKAYKGLNVTVPYKKEIISLLDDLRGDAKALRAVNTISCEDGKLIGNNTDTYGFMQLLKYNKIDPQNKVCVVLGSGGACQAIVHVLKQLKASRVVIVSRNPNNKDMCSYEDLANIKGYLIVNTTPVGTWPNVEESPVGEEVVNNFDAVVDIIYNPSMTKFLSYGIKNKKIVANGLYMLVSQAIKSQEYWQDIKYNENVVNNIYAALKKAFSLDQESNIYLIGMMSCGKTTLGKYLAKKLGYKFVDLDKEIEKESNMTIPEMFKISEEYFREIETKVLIKIATSSTKTIVSTGGGIIKRICNIYAMRITGLTLWIDRDVKIIAKYCNPANRPLLKGKNQYISSIFEERKPIYEYAKDYTIKNNGSINEGINNIEKVLKKR